MGVQYLGANPVSDTAGVMGQYGGTPLQPAAWTTAATTTNSVLVPAGTVTLLHLVTINHYLSFSVNTDTADIELACSDNGGTYAVLAHARQLGTGSQTLVSNFKTSPGLARTYRITAYRQTGSGTVQSISDPSFNSLYVTTVAVT